MRQTISGANTSVIAPVPCCQASNVSRIVSRLASVWSSVALVMVAAFAIECAVVLVGDCCGGGDQDQESWVDASWLSSSVRIEVQLRVVPLPSGCDHDRSSLVPALRLVVPRRRRTAG